MTTLENKLSCGSAGPTELAALRASLAAMTERAEKSEAQAREYYFKLVDRTTERNSATAALKSLGCELRDGVWTKPCPAIYQTQSGLDNCHLCGGTDWLPITPATSRKGG